MAALGSPAGRVWPEPGKPRETAKPTARHAARQAPALPGERAAALGCGFFTIERQIRRRRRVKVNPCPSSHFASHGCRVQVC